MTIINNNNNNITVHTNIEAERLTFTGQTARKNLALSGQSFIYRIIIIIIYKAQSSMNLPP